MENIICNELFALSHLKANNFFFKTNNSYVWERLLVSASPMRRGYFPSFFFLRALTRMIAAATIRTVPAAPYIQVP